MDPLSEFFYLTFPIFYIVGMIFTFTAVPIFVLFWKKWLPKSARTMFWCARRGTPPILLVHDSGRGELTSIIERKGEGIVMTRQGKYKILPRVMPRNLDMNTAEESMESIDVEPEGSEDNPGSPKSEESLRAQTIKERLRTVFDVNILKANFILDYTDWILKRCMLVGLKMPFFVGYTGKLCLLNPEALALYEMGEMKIRTEESTLFNPHDIEGKKLSDALQPLLLLDPRKIQQVIYNGFDQSQMAGVVADSEEIARLGKGLFSSKVLGLVLVFVFIALIGVGMFLLPSILPMGGMVLPPLPLVW